MNADRARCRRARFATWTWIAAMALVVSMPFIATWLLGR